MTKPVKMTDIASEAARMGAREATRDDSDDERPNEKGDVDVGHHAIVTGADRRAQERVLRFINLTFPDVFILTEEKAGNVSPGIEKMILGTDTYQRIANPRTRTFIIDPLDGSSSRNRHLPEYSTSVGCLKGGIHIGGAINAPAVLGGFSVSGGRRKGVSITEWGKEREATRIVSRERKKCVVFFGVDTYFIPPFHRLAGVVSSQIQTTSSTNCALGLAYVAAGKIDALVQPVQAPWDWAAGYPLVEEVGGKFQFFHYRDGNIVAMRKPDVLSYDPVRRNTAFIAGEPELVHWLFKTLQEVWGSGTTSAK